MNQVGLSKIFHFKDLIIYQDSAGRIYRVVHYTDKIVYPAGLVIDWSNVRVHEGALLMHKVTEIPGGIIWLKELITNV